MRMTFGTFIEPDQSLETLENPNEKLALPIFSGFRASEHARALLGQSRIFDAIWQRWQETPLQCEDQCSPQYYFDLVRILRDFNGQFDHVVEVGCYLGGASSVLAGCMDRFDFTLDIVDVSAPYLRYAYERCRRMYPDAAARIRLFQGDLPSYVQHVMRIEGARQSIIHHDGAHDFNLVVRDMGSLSYVQDQIFAIMAQDTHLRGSLKHMNYCPIGANYHAFDPVTQPNRFQGNYFMPDMFEGMVLPMAVNEFRYPHPSLSFEDFLGIEPQASAQAPAQAKAA